MVEIRRDDGELCGFIEEYAGRWKASTVFGAPLGEFAVEADAWHEVERSGLAVLADRWTLTDGSSGLEQVVCIQQASPAEVTVAMGYYSLPGVPTLTISMDDLGSGRWKLAHGTGDAS